MRGSQCPGSDEFIRGCRKNIQARQQANVLLGREWARQHQPAKASACRGPVPYVVLGCRQYYVEHLAKPKPAGQRKYEGMTTAECKEEVNANFEASEQLDLENGNPHSAAVTKLKSWMPALKDCENFDKLKENTFMLPARTWPSSKNIRCARSNDSVQSLWRAQHWHGSADEQIGTVSALINIVSVLE